MSHAMMLHLINYNGTIPSEIETARRCIVDFLVILLQIYWSLFLKLSESAVKNYTIVFGDNHCHGIFTAFMLLLVSNGLKNWYYKPVHKSNELFDYVIYQKQKLKYHEQDISLLMDQLESTNKKYKTMEAKIKKLEKELKKYD